MGRSISKPRPGDVPPQKLRSFQVEWRSGTLIHSVKREGHTAAYPMAWAVGSGNKGVSYLMTLGDALFQSPLSWYTARKSWDLSPGYDRDAEPDFYRPVTVDCLFCHSGSPRPIAGTLNRYESPPFEPAAIGCDRCHGDPTEHLRSNKRVNIVNPPRLEPDKRDAVCEQCHLSGATRILNPGKTFQDYRPGMRMEDVFTVYVKPSGEDGLKVVSHSEQLVLSRCYQASGRKLWCGSCHNPHQDRSDQADLSRDQCLSCHGGEQARAHRKTVGDDCTGCHMPQRRAFDGGHTAFTDHRIRVEGRELQATSGLRAWRDPAPALRRRNLGLAYLGTNEPAKAFPLLEPAAEDGVVETARGSMLLRHGRHAGAVRAFRNALKQHPNDSTRHLNLAAALFAAGEPEGAKAEAETAIQIEPLLEDAYVLLAEIEPRRAKYWKERYQRLAPQRRLP